MAAPRRCGDIAVRIVGWGEGPFLLLEPLPPKMSVHGAAFEYNCEYTGEVCGEFTQVPGTQLHNEATLCLLCLCYSNSHVLLDICISYMCESGWLSGWRREWCEWLNARVSDCICEWVRDYVSEWVSVSEWLMIATHSLIPVEILNCHNRRLGLHEIFEAAGPLQAELERHCEAFSYSHTEKHFDWDIIINLSSATTHVAWHNTCYCELLVCGIETLLGVSNFLSCLSVTVIKRS